MPADRPILLANARIVDPSRDLDIVGDLLIAEGVIREAKKGIGAAGVPEGTDVIDCRGRLIAPGLIVTICGDILHSRVARSNMLLLGTMGARVRVVAPSTLLPAGIERFGVEVHRDLRSGLADADIVMMLRLQRERMNGSYVPSMSEYFHYYGLDEKKLAYAKPGAMVMHPGPMNRGVEIDSLVADGAQSLIREQVEMGVAVRMAVLEALSRNLPNA